MKYWRPEAGEFWVNRTHDVPPRQFLLDLLLEFFIGHPSARCNQVQPEPGATRLHNRGRSIIFEVRSVCGKVRNLGGEVLEKQARITSKGQITVPREVRRVLDVRPGDRLLFESDENRVRPVRTKSPFAKFKGIGNPGIGSGREGIIRWVRELRGR